MIANPEFDIVVVSGDCIAVPIGQMATEYNGVVALSEPAAFLLKCMESPTTIDELTVRLLEEYDVDESTAHADVIAAIDSFRKLKLVLD